MRTTLTLTLLFILALPVTGTAEVILRRADSEAVETPIPTQINRAAITSGSAIGPEQTLVVPFYEVDTTNPAGTATLYAVRNTSFQPVDINVRYQASDGTALHQEFLTLAGEETRTRNVRDVAGLPVDPDGFTRGFIVILQTSNLGADLLVGDYLQVDVDNAFATGQRMASLDEFCNVTEVRFLDFGAGTELRLMVASPQGSNPSVDPVSIVVHPILEDGTPLPTTDIYTNQFSLKVSASDFTGAAFGTLLFQFANSGGGLAYAEYSARGLFSVGLGGSCNVPVP